MKKHFENLRNSMLQTISENMEWGKMTDEALKLFNKEPDYFCSIFLGSLLEHPTERKSGGVAASAGLSREYYDSGIAGVVSCLKESGFKECMKMLKMIGWLPKTYTEIFRRRNMITYQNSPLVKKLDSVVLEFRSKIETTGYGLVTEEELRNFLLSVEELVEIQEI